jgi:hypothetical protein
MGRSAQRVCLLLATSGCGGIAIGAQAPRQEGGVSDEAGAEASSSTEASAQPVASDGGWLASSCNDVHLQRPEAASGIYTLALPSGPAPAYCDMQTAGGGFTSFFAGRVGAANTFAYFEDKADTCPDAAGRCLRHLPVTLSTGTLFLATCGDAAVTFQMDFATVAFFRSGAQSRWRPLQQVTAASPSAHVEFATSVWTGDGANKGFILSNDDNIPSFTPHTLLSSYDYNALWDFCNGAPDTSSVVRLFYR